MNNDQIKVTEKDKKALKKVWFFLFIYILLMMYLLYFRIWLGLGDNVRTIVFSLVLVFLITNTIFLILKVKKRIHGKKKTVVLSLLSKKRQIEKKTRAKKWLSHILSALFIISSFIFFLFY